MNGGIPLPRKCGWALASVHEAAQTQGPMLQRCGSRRRCRSLAPQTTLKALKKAQAAALQLYFSVTSGSWTLARVHGRIRRHWVHSANFTGIIHPNSICAGVSMTIGWIDQPLLVGGKLLGLNLNRVAKIDVLPPVLSGTL